MDLLVPHFLKGFLGERRIKYYLDHAIYMLILVTLIPGFFYFEMIHVRPVVVDPESGWNAVHISCAFFLLFNIVGNLMFGIFTDTSIKGRILRSEKNQLGWSTCAVCETITPPRSWHCDSCNICILKRDHHCNFFARCVGYFNFRYFLMLVLHIFLAMVYSLCFNVLYLAKVASWNHGLVLVKFFLPLIHFAWDFNEDENVYILVVVVNIIVGVFTGILLVYHIKNVMEGATAGEHANKNKTNNLYNLGIRKNLIEVLGHRWYLTWISPFIDSSLTGDGITWNEKCT